VPAHTAMAGRFRGIFTNSRESHLHSTKVIGILISFRNSETLNYPIHNPGPDLASRLPGFIRARSARAGFRHSSFYIVT